MYRWPKQSDNFNKVFYQLSYIRLASENMHLPSAAEAARLVETDFDGHVNALGVKREIVKLLTLGRKLCVYGANWGYEVAQFAKAGFEARGFELSRPRAEFAATNLKVNVSHDLENIRSGGPYDVIYCSHTLEHLPTPEPVFQLFRQIAAPSGMLVLFVPNCGGANAQTQGVRWGPFSSSLHPLSYTAEFFEKALPKYGFSKVVCFSDPYDMERISGFNRSGPLTGDELLIIARRA